MRVCDAVPDAVAYVHEDNEALPYVHEDIAAELYVHEEIPAEAHVHEEPAETHDIAAEAYMHEEVEADVHQEPAPAPVVSYAVAPVAYAGYPYTYSLPVATAPAASTEVRGVDLQTNLYLAFHNHGEGPY